VTLGVQIAVAHSDGMIIGEHGDNDFYICIFDPLANN